MQSTHSIIKTDLDLSKCFKDPISEDYKTALEFLTFHPDYALVKFRNILSYLCSELADLNNVKFDTDVLYKKIDHLYNCRLIKGTLKDNFHQARKLGNSGAHTPPLNEISKEVFDQNKAVLIENAQKARDLMVDIFKTSYSLLNKGVEILEVDCLSFGIQKYKEILYEAAISPCSKAKLKAGVVYEAIENEMRLTAPPFIIPADLDYHLKSLSKHAASHYEASYKISANMDARLFSTKDPQEAILKYCELEPLFKYSVIASSGALGEAEKENGYQLMEIAAKRGYGPAEAYYGALLFDDGKYEYAKKYLERSSKKEEPLALRFLYHYYSEELVGELDSSLALKYLDEAISLGCFDSLAYLGIAYHEGSVIKKDDSKAKEILKKAAMAGSIFAHQYYIREFEGLEKKFLDKCKEFANALDAVKKELKPKPIQRGKKIGPNEKCPCGSGKKYKKCCKDKPSEQKKA